MPLHTAAERKKRARQIGRVAARIPVIRGFTRTGTQASALAQRRRVAAESPRRPALPLAQTSLGRTARRIQQQPITRQVGRVAASAERRVSGWLGSWPTVYRQTQERRRLERPLLREGVRKIQRLPGALRRGLFR